MFLCVYDTLRTCHLSIMQPIFAKSYHILAPLKLRPYGAIQICLLLLLSTFIYVLLLSFLLKMSSHISNKLCVMFYLLGPTQMHKM